MRAKILLPTSARLQDPALPLNRCSYVRLRWAERHRLPHVPVGQVRVFWTRGHSGLPGNERADHLARARCRPSPSSRGAGLGTVTRQPPWAVGAVTEDATLKACGGNLFKSAHVHVGVVCTWQEAPEAWFKVNLGAIGDLNCGEIHSEILEDVTQTLLVGHCWEAWRCVQRDGVAAW